MVDYEVFLNPNLDPNSIKIGPPPEKIDFSTMLARRVADSIIEAYRSLMRTSYVGTILRDVEELIVFLEYQPKGSMLRSLYLEIVSAEGTLGSLIEDSSTLSGKIY